MNLVILASLAIWFLISLEIRWKRRQILKHLHTIPEDATPLPKFNRLLKGQQKLLKEKVLDWGLAELMAYGSILMDGQDVHY